MTNKIIDPEAQTLKNHNIIEHGAETYANRRMMIGPIKALLLEAHIRGGLDLLREIESGRIIPRKPKKETDSGLNESDNRNE